MHVLRAEKGYIIVGQDTDGSVTPSTWNGCDGRQDQGLPRQAFAFSQRHCAADRKQFVGLFTEDPQIVLTEGRRVSPVARRQSRHPMAGHVTSTTPARPLAGFDRAGAHQGRSRPMGERVQVAMRDGRTVTAIANPVFFDPHRSVKMATT